jgi:hypothetical protein
MVSWRPAGAASRALSEFHGGPRRRSDDLRAGGGEALGHGGAVLDLERDANRSGYATTDLHLVDVLGVAGIGQLQSGLTRAENGHPTTVRGVGGVLGQAEDIAVEAQRFVVVRCGDA